MAERQEASALLTVRDVAAMLKISPYTLRRWIKSEKIEIVRLSRKNIRFELDTIKRWIKLHTTFEWEE